MRQRKYILSVWQTERKLLIFLSGSPCFLQWIKLNIFGIHDNWWGRSIATPSTGLQFARSTERYSKPKKCLKGKWWLQRVQTPYWNALAIISTHIHRAFDIITEQQRKYKIEFDKSRKLCALYSQSRTIIRFKWWRTLTRHRFLCMAC